MKKFILIALVFMACSEDPQPQKSCETLNAELQTVEKQLIDHQAKGNGGNQAAWETELRRLMDLRNKTQHEISKRLC